MIYIALSRLYVLVGVCKKIEEGPQIPIKAEAP
jgi:hypothetical protein